MRSLATLLVLLMGATTVATGQSARYRFLATAESDDQVVLAEFVPCTAGTPSDGCGVKALRTFEVGRWPTEMEGPHGVVPSRDGTTFYVSLAHGLPFGYLQKVDLETGASLGFVELGMFPATVDLGVGGLIFVVNFNFEDPTMAPSSVSVVDGDGMDEVARTMTCRMPHGSRLNPQGSHHYSGCMMDDLLVEVDARTFAVTRAFGLVSGQEGPVDLAGGDHPAMEHGEDHGPAMSSTCSPTWAQPSADGSRVYVACNKSAEVVEVDARNWSLVRRWKTPAAPYNMAVTPDGRLLVITQKGPGTTSVWRIADATLLGDLPGSRRIASGVVVSADSRYAFVTLEGVGGDPGTVDVIDLNRLERVASLEMGKQAGGIAMMP